MSRFKLSLVLCTAFMVLAQPCMASLILDPGFEDPNSSMFFVLNGDALPDFPAQMIDPAIEGNESLRLVGNGDQAARFSQAFQDIPVDGLNISVGDQVVLNGDIGQLSSDALFMANRAFLEIAFVDSSGSVFLGGFQSVGIGSASPLDSFQSQTTPAAIVPSGATQVRVLAIFDEQTLISGENSGAAFVDNLELTVTGVPEPSTGSVIAAALVMIFARRRR